MIKIYPLEWLDTLITQTLVHENSSINSITDQDLFHICKSISNESKNIQIQIKKEIFSLRKKSHIRLLIRKYHAAFIFLVDQVVENQNYNKVKTGGIKQIGDSIINTLEELLGFLELRFSNFLSLDQRAPLTYISVSGKEFRQRMEKIKIKNFLRQSDIRIINSVLDSLVQQLESRNNTKSTYRNLRYRKELLGRIEQSDFTENVPGLFSMLDEMLIRLNFNSPDYYHLLLQRLSENLLLKKDREERMDFLLVSFKEINQLESAEKKSFDPFEVNIKKSLLNWIDCEISYLQRCAELQLNHKDSFSQIIEPKHELLREKVQCILSTDQMGLILRAGDESRLLKARSMNQIFKTIVPYLSSPQKRELSYKSMRSKSYNAEERDKEIAISALERIIKHIKDY